MNTHTHYIHALWRWCVVIRIPGMCMVFTGFQSLFWVWWGSWWKLFANNADAAVQRLSMSVHACSNMCGALLHVLASMNLDVCITTVLASMHLDVCITTVLASIHVLGHPCGSMSLQMLWNGQSAGAKCSQSMLIHGKTYSEDDFHKDPIMLQNGNRWMSLWEMWATKLDCPGTPPSV